MEMESKTASLERELSEGNSFYNPSISSPPATPQSMLNTPGPPIAHLAHHKDFDGIRPASAPVPPGQFNQIGRPSSVGAVAGLNERPISPTKLRVQNLSGRISDLQQGIQVYLTPNVYKQFLM